MQFDYSIVKNSDEENGFADNFPAPFINYIYKYVSTYTRRSYIFMNIKNHY